MKALVLITAAAIASLTIANQVAATDRSHHQPSISHGASVTPVGHHGHHGHHRYYPPRHGCYRPYPYRPPIYHPPVVVPFPGHPPVVHPPVYRHRYYRHGYHHGGFSLNTGRVGFSIAF